MFDEDKFLQEVEEEIKQEDREEKKSRLRTRRRCLAENYPVRYRISRLWVRLCVSFLKFFKGE